MKIYPQTYYLTIDNRRTTAMGEEINRIEICNTISQSSHLANEIATSAFSMTESERDDINLTLGVKYDSNKFSDNIARLSDEMMRVYLQLSGGHIHSISKLLRSPDSNPSIQALTRTAIDAAAYGFWISDSTDPTTRVSRAVKLVHPRLSSMEALGADKSLIGRWKASFRKVINSPNFDKKSDTSQKSIRDSLLQGVSHWQKFNNLHNYVHADPSIAMSDYLINSFAPEKIRNEDLKSATFATSLLLKSATSISKFRTLRGGLPEELKDVSKKIDGYIENI